jgi:hypothetical protein
MTVYKGNSIYRVLTVLCVALVALLGWQLWKSWDWGALLFVVVAAWCAYRCYVLMASKVELTEDRVRATAPGSAPREVLYRQLSSVYEEGRAIKSILLLYYPRGESGLFDLDEENSLVLPAVNEQNELFEALNAKVPR